MDINDELYFCRSPLGIQLRQLPVKLIGSEPINTPFYTNTRVKDLLELPFCIFFSNTQHVIKCVNDTHAEYCGFDSRNEAVDKTLHSVFTEDTASSITKNNFNVMQSSKSHIFEESALRQDGVVLNVLVIKFPWYNEINQLMGVFGCSIIQNKNYSLANSLNIIRNLGLLNNSNSLPLTPSYIINSVSLSEREYECLHHTIRGKSAKQIAYHLNISCRTVEEYLSNIKNKMGVYSKNELIEKTIDYFINP